MRTHFIALALLLCLGLLAACGGERELSGELAEFQLDGAGQLAALVLETDRGRRVGVLLEESTHVGSWVESVDGKTFRENPRLHSGISAACEGPRQSITTENGETIAAYRGRTVSVHSVLNPSAAVLPDGTALDLVETANSDRYQLPDGTVILWEDRCQGPEHVYVGGLEGFDALSAAAQERVGAYYREQGLLYDLRGELERAYAGWLDFGGGEEAFSPYTVGQQVVPSGASEQVMYFLTLVTLPVRGGVCQERRLCAAFDRETGTHVDTWALFTCPPEEAMAALLDRAALDDPALRREMEAAFDPEGIVFSSVGLEIWFPRGSLPSQEFGASFFLDYSALEDILQSWAIPQAGEE